MGTRWDPVSDKARHRSHTYVGVHLLVKNPTAQEKLATLRVMDRLPVLWSEAAGKDYFAEIAIPSEMMLEALLVLQGVMGAVNNKATFHIMDQRNSAAFTIPHKLYDEASRMDLQQARTTGQVQGPRNRNTQSLESESLLLFEEGSVGGVEPTREPENGK